MKKIWNCLFAAAAALALAGCAREEALPGNESVLEDETGATRAGGSSTTTKNLLKAHEWRLIGVEAVWDGYPDDAEDVIQSNSAGNSIKFKSGSKMVFDFSANGGKTRDYYNETDVTLSNVGSMRWSVSQGNQLSFSGGGFPAVKMGQNTFTVESVDNNILHLSTRLWDGTYHLYFTATSWVSDPYDIPNLDDIRSSSTLVWEDDFDEPDYNINDKWDFEFGHNGGWGDDQLQYYCENGVFTYYTREGRRRISHDITSAYVSEGSLKIDAIDLGAPNSDADGCRYISSRMSTNEYWTYGLIEMKAKLPQMEGCWPAFWMLPKFGPADVMDESRTGGELDILENVPYWDPTEIWFSAHSYNATTEAGEDTGYLHPVSNVLYSYTGAGIEETPEDWHVYSMLWSHTEIRAFIDGEQYYYCPNPLPYGCNDDPGYMATWPFDQPFYIKLNLAVGGGWGGTVQDEFDRETFEVDYVRVYNLSNLY